MTRGPVDPIPPEGMLGASDWDDEDLLTVVAAAQRLAGEIEACRQRIRHAEQALDDPQPSAIGAALAAERKRLRALIEAAERITAAQREAPR